MGLNQWKIDGHYPTKLCRACGAAIQVKSRDRWERTRFCSNKCRSFGYKEHVDVAPEELLACSGCGVEKQASCFRRDKTRTTRGGWAYLCKACDSERLRGRQPSENELANKRNAYLVKTFGITSEQFEVMKNKQDGLCGICGEKETFRRKNGEMRELAVDHDHETGQVRGLLCFKCNTALGKFGDSEEMLEKAIQYLRNSSIHETPDWA